MDHFSLRDRTALITGASRGLGSHIAETLAEAGADLVLTGRSPEGVTERAEEIGSRHGVTVRTYVADLATPEGASSLAEWLAGPGQDVDILINNAGDTSTQDAAEIDLAEWHRLQHLMLTAPMILTRAIAPAMRARGWGRIIHITSIQALGSTDRKSSYSAAKTGLLGLMRAQACDLGPDGITVNCIAPGLFMTDLAKGTYSEESVNAIASRTTLGRPGEVHEIAGPVLLLASDAGSYISGETLVVDGGVMARSI